MAAVLQPISDVLCHPSIPYSPLITWQMVVVLSLPHILYAVVWFRPQLWRSVFNDESLETFALAGTLGKVVQFASLLFWLWVIRPTGLCFSPEAIPLWRWLVFLLLTTVGQALNVGIYKAIGKTGVYYGFKLGRKVPWVTGFPFNVMSHPQYVGTTMTIWGVLLLIHAVTLPAQQPAIVYLVVYWSCLYAITGVKEHCF